jgi:hypothetical protein
MLVSEVSYNIYSLVLVEIKLTMFVRCEVQVLVWNRLTCVELFKASAEEKFLVINWWFWQLNL